ncbi:MAG: hypothetical protein Q8J84_10725 [Flavobacteriaceae bacterium]|nr:hypothetical protein [Flavobacteriaceae bacterium]
MKHFISQFILLLSIQVSAQNVNIELKQVQKLNLTEQSIYQWISHQQLPNGLIKNTDNSTNSSLYNNALAAILFTSQSDFKRAEAIFDYFEKQLKKEFSKNKGGFSQMRNLNGEPNHRTWMGDNAWLLIAINTYHHQTKTQKYRHLANVIENWLRSLQDKDGGLWGGYEANGQHIHKNTEGMLDAFHAVRGFDDFHQNILRFLKDNRWNSAAQFLTTTEESYKYSIALDLHSWSYCILEDFSKSSLIKAKKFLTTQTISNTKKPMTGYCFDADNDCVWLEGTGQMVVAYQFSKNNKTAQFYLNEMTKTIIASPSNPDLKGLPYVSNNATNFGGEIIWKNADAEPSISSSVWYLFGALKYNPFEIDFKKEIPNNQKFWLK